MFLLVSIKFYKLMLSLEQVLIVSAIRSRGLELRL